MHTQTTQAPSPLTILPTDKSLPSPLNMELQSTLYTECAIKLNKKKTLPITSYTFPLESLTSKKFFLLNVTPLQFTPISQNSKHQSYSVFNFLLSWQVMTSILFYQPQCWCSKRDWSFICVTHFSWASSWCMLIIQCLHANNVSS